MNTINERRSIRKYKEEEVPKHLIEELIEALLPRHLLPRTDSHGNILYILELEKVNY